MIGSDTVADEFDGVDEVVGGGGTVRGGRRKMLMNSERSRSGSTYINTPVLGGSGGSLAVRSTTGFASVVRARLAGGASN